MGTNDFEHVWSSGARELTSYFLLTSGHLNPSINYDQCRRSIIRANTFPLRSDFIASSSPSNVSDHNDQVEEKLFAVSIARLKAKSEIFRDMISIPQPKTGTSPEGASTASPIVLEGIKSDDFGALLQFLSLARDRKYVLRMLC